MNAPLTPSRATLRAAIDRVKDPISGKGLWEAGRLGGLECSDDGRVIATLEVPREAASAFADARAEAEAALGAIAGVTNARVVLTAHEDRAAPAVPPGKGLRDVKLIIAVASAKGGVGKSTIAVNLACAFAALGQATGLLDIDVYGPSAPTLLGVGDAKPEALPDKTLKPIAAWGLQTMSIGYLVSAETAMVWRGAMATSAVRQMLEDVAWGALDVRVLDLPPGTGDVHLTLLQRAPLAGAVIVSTPQEMALADVRRGVAMLEKMHAPILGIVENMAWFEGPDGSRSHIFGEGGARRTAEAAGVRFLGELPIDVALREASDAGAPLAATQPDHPISQRFLAIAAAALEEAAHAAKPAPTIRFV
jgi:ATP-binding protein involved in chromosome partitioning